MSFYLKDLQESLDYLFNKGREINPGGFTFIMKYLLLAVFSMLSSVLSVVTDWGVAPRIGLILLSLGINALIVRRLLWRLRHPSIK
jgi:hypothetical protein